MPTNKNNDEKRINKFQIEVLSGGKTPTYIRKGEIRFDSVILGQYTTGGKQKMKKFIIIQILE